MPTDAPTDVAGLLRAHGLRVTPQRRVIWAAFENGRAGHLSADQVLQRARVDLPELSKSTAYSALSEFVAAGLLVTVDGDGAQLFDPNVDDHQHFRCRSCGELFDVHPVGVDGIRLRERGFRIETTRITFDGVCSGCR